MICERRRSSSNLSEGDVGVCSACCVAVGAQDFALANKLEVSTALEPQLPNRNGFPRLVHFTLYDPKD
jgi:hypothetical protein